MPHPAKTKTLARVATPRTGQIPHMPLRNSKRTHARTDDPSSSPPPTTVAVVTVACEQDLSHLKRLTADLRAALKTGQPVIVDVSQTTLIDSTSISTILRAADEARTPDQPFTICAPTTNPAPANPLAVGASSRAHIANTIEHALAHTSLPNSPQAAVLDPLTTAAKQST